MSACFQGGWRMGTTWLHHMQDFFFFSFFLLCTVLFSHLGDRAEREASERHFATETKGTNDARTKGGNQPSWPCRTPVSRTCYFSCSTFVTCTINTQKKYRCIFGFIFSYTVSSKCSFPNFWACFRRRHQLPAPVKVGRDVVCFYQKTGSDSWNNRWHSQGFTLSLISHFI